MDSSSGPSSARNEKSALSEVFNHWKVGCLESPNDVPTTSGPYSTSQLLKATRLRADSKAFFQYLVNNTRVDVDGNNKLVLETKSSHEDALAKLVQELGPAFSSGHQHSRLLGLSVIAGALEGCGSGSGSNISNPMCKLIGSFMLSHGGPLSHDDEEEGDVFEEHIRDAAIIGLTALVSLPADVNAVHADSKVAVEALKLRLSFAQQGVQHRCALPETEENAIVPDIRGGLSALPRSKRSLCFQLIDGAVRGVSIITNQLVSHISPEFDAVQKNMVVFASFVTDCIHGESDPRCLLQLMKLLASTQRAFESWFQTCRDAASVFPTADVFDAVAPYYPIQFQPPPNNIHGITREGLHSALLNVLCYVDMDAEAKRHNRHTMLNLSAGLFIEQLLPAGGRVEENYFDEVEKLEALQCLESLLFPLKSSSCETAVISNCSQLSTDIVRDLSMALITIHNDSSRAAAQYGLKGKNNKRLAETCRTLVSKIAFHLEFISSGNCSLWKVFVLDPLEKESGYLKSAAARARTHIAYSACLAASGGPRTLRCCLKATLAPLLDGVLSRPRDELLQDYENVATAAFGLGALFSSSRLAMNRARNEGVAFHPHPLDDYSAKAFHVLYCMLEDSTDMGSLEGDATTHPPTRILPLPVKVAAVRSLESVLLAISADQLQAEDDRNNICQLVESLAKLVSTASLCDEEIEWKIACGRTLGSLLGHSLDLGKGCDGKNFDIGVLATDAMQNLMAQGVYPTILASATTRIEAESSRVDRDVLAWACSCGPVAARTIIGSLLQSLTDSLRRKHVDKSSTVLVAKSLSHVLSSGGDVAILAYHEISDPCAKDEDIIQELTKIGNSTNQITSRASIENLTLPATIEERAAVTITNRFSYEIIQHLLPAYAKFVPDARIEKLIKAISDVVPPLSDKDSARLSILLPLLAASLQGKIVAKPHASCIDKNEYQAQKMLTTLTKDLAEYALNQDNHSDARTAAASCLHAATIAIGNGHECPVLPILRKIIAPSLTCFAETFNKSADPSAITSILDCLTLLSVLGSAATCRRGNSLSSSDTIALFLVRLACEGKSSISFQDETLSVDFKQSQTTRTNRAFEIAAAAGFGSMLSSGTTQVTKQRLKHIALKVLQEARETNVAAHRSEDAFGQVAIACHIICNGDKFEKRTIQELAAITLNGMSGQFFEDAGYSGNLKLVLVSTLKLICMTPSAISSKLAVVRGLLRAYAVSDISSDIGCKLLALQGLESLALMDGSSEVVGIKTAVLSVLGAAINHPSSLLRQAAVDVRNAWHTLE